MAGIYSFALRNSCERRRRILGEHAYVAANGPSAGAMTLRDGTFPG
jgi:hypothetical protein